MRARRVIIPAPADTKGPVIPPGRMGTGCTDVALMLGASLRAERLRRGVSLPEFERQTGLKASVVGAYERGERWPGRETLGIIGNWLSKSSLLPSERYVRRHREREAT